MNEGSILYWIVISFLVAPALLYLPFVPLGFVATAYYKFIFIKIPTFLLYRLWKMLYNFIFKAAGTKASDGEKPPAHAVSATPKGFVFGKDLYRGDYLCKAEEKDGHIMVVGGAGSGKTSCLAIPSLIAWQKRVFAIDIKGELYRKTGKKRTSAKVFNPMDSNSYGYDPFYLLSKSDSVEQEIAEISIALIAIPPDTKDSFWLESARNVLTGALIHFHSEGLSFVQAVSTILETPVNRLLNQVYKNDLSKRYVTRCMEMRDETLGNIMNELGNNISIFATDKNIQKVFSKPVIITPQDLENGFDVFLSIPEDKLRQWKGLLTLIVSQFLNHFERRPDSKATPVLFLLDEFPRLGKVAAISDALATLRSKKITICLIIQSLAQLDVIYGKPSRQVISDNCSYKAILRATDADTQAYFSRLVGTYEKVKESRSESKSPITGITRGKSISTSLEDKPIIRPEEFATLDNIVLLTPDGFQRAVKTPYYKTSAFSLPEAHIIPIPHRTESVKHTKTLYVAPSADKSVSKRVDKKDEPVIVPPTKPTSREKESEPKIDKGRPSSTSVPKKLSIAEIESVIAERKRKGIENWNDGLNLLEIKLEAQIRKQFYELIGEKDSSIDTLLNSAYSLKKQLRETWHDISLELALGDGKEDFSQINDNLNKLEAEINKKIQNLTIEFEKLTGKKFKLETTETRKFADKKPFHCMETFIKWLEENDVMSKPSKRDLRLGEITKEVEEALAPIKKEIAAVTEIAELEKVQRKLTLIETKCNVGRFHAKKALSLSYEDDFYLERLVSFIPFFQRYTEEIEVKRKELKSSASKPLQSPYKSINIEEFAEWLMSRDEKLSGVIDKAVLKRTKSSLIDNLHSHINAMVLKEMPTVKIEEYERVIKAGSPEAQEKFVSANIPDLEEKLLQALTDFAETYLG